MNSEKVQRTCRCGHNDCKVTFLVSVRSLRIYYSRRHKENAKAYRRKLKDAGVLLPN